MRPLRAVEFIHGLNAPREQFVTNIQRNMERGIKSLQTKRALLVAGGPSAADHLDDIRSRHEQGWELFCVNGAHDWLVRQRIIPNFCVVLEAGEVANTFIRLPQPSCHYLLASQCHPSLFDRLVSHDVTIWHASLDVEANRMVAETDTKATIMAPQNTAGLHTLAIMYMKAVKKARAYGMDSSHRHGSDHAYDNSQQTHADEVEFYFQDKLYLSTGTWAAQAEAFARVWPVYFKLGMKIDVIGDGLLPAMAQVARQKLFAELAIPQTEKSNGHD